MCPTQSLCWADLDDDSMDNEVVSNNIFPSQSLSWADLRDDSMDNDSAQSDLKDSSMGVKRDLDIADLSLHTDDGYGDAPGAHRKRMKNMCTGLPNTSSIATWPVSVVQGPVPCVVPVVMFPLQAVPSHHGLAARDDIADPLATPGTGDTERKLKKRMDEVQLIQRDFPEDVVATTFLGRAGLYNVAKRAWEEAKAEYRNNLKLSQLKMQTQLDEEFVKLALETVHKESMKTKMHVQAALELIPRLNGIVQHLMREGASASKAMVLVKQTYSREDDVLISAEDHLSAALAVLKK